MKFTFDRDAMIKEISIAQEIISTKNAGSILSNVLLSAKDNTLLIKATDIKVNFETKIPVQIEEEGSTTVYCDKFMGILSSLPEGEIEFNQTSDGEDQAIVVIIKPVAKKINFKIKSMSQEKFPEFDSAENVPYFEVPSQEIKEMICQTAFAVSEDETRYFMNGVYFEKEGDKLNLVATDGRRLSYASKELLAGVNEFPAAIVHPKILNIILKHAPAEGNISISIVDKMIFFKFGNYKFGSVLLEGQFPNYKRVIPENQSYTAILNKIDFSVALSRVAIFAEQKAKKILFDFTEDTLTISAEDSEVGNAKAKIACQYKGDDMRIAVNYVHFTEPVKAMEEDDIAIKFSEPNRAITLNGVPESEFFHIIMPMQL